MRSEQNITILAGNGMTMMWSTLGKELFFFLFSFLRHHEDFFRVRVLLAIRFVWTNASFSPSSPLFPCVIFLVTEKCKNEEMLILHEGSHAL